jgi:bla regulator protein BlaR1
MSVALIVGLAWKSALCAGLTLLALRLLAGRSASERSRVAHAGLVVLLLLPLAMLFGPDLEIGQAELVRQAVPAGLAAPGGEAMAAAAVQPSPAIPAETALWLLLVAPAALLFMMTLVAVLRLQRLRSRSEVLLDPRWLTALAAMQQRFGFKHGTALLVSRELASPISWGLVRPVILLDERASANGDEAEAVIAHELAHVARLDWAKLIAGRAATALFWFNPLVWLLARRCHELREEAADDAVLRTDFERADYAELLVGIARHENRGILLAANGVAPSRGSLARRIHCVLDPGLRRVPAGLAFSIGCAALALGVGGTVAAVEPARARIVLVGGDAPRVPAETAAPDAMSEAPPARRPSEPRTTRAASPAPVPAAVAPPGRSARSDVLLEDAAPEVRGQVARALGEAGSTAHSGAIARLLRDPDPAVRLQAAHALGDLQDPATRPALEAAQGDADPRVRAKVGWALRQVREAEALLRRFGGG